ncbi:MAG: polyribonucleotide nucleotidyltransferase [Bacteroidetes bacterium 24-39-8]|jgi:polyribonucleotide nucleotidyltransferase|nr:MAG: polyribonucleotide nucleotidyltransferase [Sphingobacteriia bacterium 35-40-8]OYZ51460.1 MAG: polyribonucleotide nucleotidyltransferase [Bacteroidetes bacterium 24-39-8]OZA68317.1 MAG: polyribonucleotide nucleotidyltransferase [Sphingobacteriia bacterium 39-39-8]HQR91819.1 polyribonucleotide nucleotidyltransferase [Sediminibacterium sp.]HQS54882.1 polyribonucleotide nucleotidyltransferase [Sediminibacterium sp.]
MLSQPTSVKFDLGGGREVTIGTGKLARQADGAVTVSQGNCMILATVVANKDPKEGQDFFPLSVDYQEKFASAGRIPGSFFKREARLNDYEILTSRLIDRALRPLFPEDYLCDVQVLVTLVSSDPEIMPDSLACLAASAALAVSDIPVMEIISEVRIGRINGEYIINPTRSQLAQSDLEFLIAATEKNLMMVEGEAKECAEADLVKALQIAHDAIRIQIKAQADLRAQLGITTKRDYKKPASDEAVNEKVIAFAKQRVYEISRKGSAKHERSDAYAQLKDELIASLGTEVTDLEKKLAKKYYEDLKWTVVRDMMLEDRIRLDGRKLDQVRPLAMEVEPLPSPHGSALFTRGETQSLTTVTFGTKLDQLLLETAAKSDYGNFFLHYNFPPFSTGEVKMIRGVGRREVGHGNLAMRSLKQMMPGNDYPYTVRVVSDILESNGSSSMATVCAGSLALMDAGVPVPKHVSGVAMGLITRADGKYAILTDILGDEDHLGDMDFKVTGTRDGICGVQMDIKVDGLSMEVMMEALEQARAGRLHILDAMYECISEARADVKPHAPRMVKLIIDKEFIGAVIGPGGKVIQEIQRETGTTINIEEVGNTGEVSIFSASKEAVDKAVAWVRGITAVPQVGDVYEGPVKGIKEFGAFVEFMPGKQGLLHISEISWSRLETMDGLFKEGDMVKVKLVGLDPKTGKFKLSRKVLMPRPEGSRPREERNDAPEA